MFLTRTPEPIVLSFWLASAALAAGEAPIAPLEYAARRAKVIEGLSKAPHAAGVLLIRSPQSRNFANDVEYPYRPDNGILYLSGAAVEGAALLLSAKEIDGLGREALFLPPPSPGEGLWISRRPTPAQASASSGIPEKNVLPIERLPETLRKALPAPRFHHGPAGEPPARLYFDPHGRSRPGEPLPEGYGFLVAHLGSAAFHLDLKPHGEVLDRLRQVKSRAEIALLRKAIDITVEAHRAAMRAARPGIDENHLAAVIEYEYRARGARGWAFPSIVGSGPNACILHYDRYDRRLVDGDLVLMDIGAEYGWYAADVTRTVPVSGRFTDRQRRVYQIVYEAQEAVFRTIRPGLPYGEVNRVARDVVAAGLIGLGLIQDKSDVGKYLPHGITHGLGLDVHDPMPEATLAPGMVITVEPGIYIPEESLGVRIEDDVLVTETGCEILSAGAPRSAGEVERWMRSESL